jgi:hypothetical protein
MGVVTASLAFQGESMKISPKYAGLMVTLILAITMSLVMSFFMVAMNLGFTEHFLFAWLRSWGLGFLIGFPTAALVVPVARRIVAKLTT